MRFEWDREKNRINQRKHCGIAFEAAALIFDDPNVVFCRDRVVGGEQRWHAIGAAEGAVLPVVHVYRTEHANGEEEIIRIISARAANQRERRIYIQQAAE
ncbi:MAG: BrnT family toxin [Bryobacteraceae bacterium]